MHVSLCCVKSIPLLKGDATGRKALDFSVMLFGKKKLRLLPLCYSVFAPSLLSPFFLFLLLLFPRYIIWIEKYDEVFVFKLPPPP